MADDDNIPFHKLSAETFNKATKKVLSMESEDPEIKKIIEGMTKLLREELKETITVKVDGVSTEVNSIYVVVGGVKKKGIYKLS